MRQCQQHDVAVVFCDERHLPVSIALPLWDGNSLHARVLRDQISITEPTRKRLWQQIVRQKIFEQITTLQQAGGTTKRLQRLYEKVRSGDPENCEAQAARHYWGELMGRDFRRDTDGDGLNSLLNYGYAVMRAMVARALVGTGLHPAIGLHHKNQYNGLCLADDIMEPFRPWVDWQVYKLKQGSDHCPVIDRDSKRALLGLLSSNVLFDERKMPLMVAVHLLVARLKQAFSEKQKLLYPQRLTF